MVGQGATSATCIRRRGTAATDAGRGHHAATVAAMAARAGVCLVEGALTTAAKPMRASRPGSLGGHVHAVLTLRGTGWWRRSGRWRTRWTRRRQEVNATEPAEAKAKAVGKAKAVATRKGAAKAKAAAKAKKVAASAGHEEDAS